MKLVKELFTVKEVCLLLNISEAKLRSAIFKKEIKFSKLGRLIRFTRKDLDDYINCKRVERREV